MDDVIIAVDRGPLAASVDAHLDATIEADGEAVKRFLREGMDLRAHWGSFAQGVPSAEGRVVSFNFRPDHLPEGLERVREWLRAQPFVRLIEVERYHPPI